MMNEKQQPSPDLLEEAIHAFQRASVPERPLDAEILALLSARQGDLVQTPRIPYPSSRRFRMYAIISSTAAAVLLSAGLVLYLWNNSPPKPEPEPAAIAVTKAPGQSRASLADPPAALNRAPKADLSALPVPRLEDTVKESPVVVVAAAESFTPAPPSTIPGDTPQVLIQFKVKRVLKGKYAAKTFTTRLSNEKIAGRDQVSQIVGKDWVVCLSPNFLAGKTQSAPLTTAEFEKRFKDIIANEMK
jgi:hypothetical protein